MLLLTIREQRTRPRAASDATPIVCSANSPKRERPIPKLEWTLEYGLQKDLVLETSCFDELLTPSKYLAGTLLLYALSITDLSIVEHGHFPTNVESQILLVKNNL